MQAQLCQRSVAAAGGCTQPNCRRESCTAQPVHVRTHCRFHLSPSSLQPCPWPQQLCSRVAGCAPRARSVAARGKGSSSDAAGELREAHKIFDEVFITVKSGDGGNGEIVEAGRGKYVSNLKYHAGGNQPKQIWLSASEPADGADGADVYVVCDPCLDSLLHLHRRKSWAGARGAQGNPAVGSSGPKRNAAIKKATTPPLLIPVPPGTVVKRKSTGQVLGEVLQPGERLLVARGGKGGNGVRAPSRLQKQRDLQRELKNAEKSGGEVVAIEDVNWRADAKGLPGRQLGLHLLMRVVADVGIVGFPNAGKSSLLSALTRASPEVAPYPFTTLMPNLGVMATGGSAPVLADLPGLIEGAHMGKGLGRLFLRHLRRTRLLLHVLDAAAPDPATDYLAVREELRMYSPAYVARPHVVALNKMDLEDAGALRQEVADEVMAAARSLQAQHAADAPGLTAPACIVAVSALSGEGVQALAAALQASLEQLSAGQPAQEVAVPLQLATDPAAWPGSSSSSSGGGGADEGEAEAGDWQGEAGEWEGEAEHDWADDSRLAAGATSSSNSSSSEGGEDEAPPPLEPEDAAAFAQLSRLSDEELLALADVGEPV